MRSIQIMFNKNEYSFVLTEEGLTKVGSDMRLTQNDVVDIPFNLLRIDQDVPHTPTPIDLTNKIITFRAVQIGPVPEDKHLVAPKTITIVGTNQIPLADGVVLIEFTALNTNIAGVYKCNIVMADIVEGTTETCRYPFSLDIREEI